jgi:hypothetical protein
MTRTFKSASMTGDTCVEVAVAPDGVWVRDSKDRLRIQGFTRAAWAAFLKEVTK